MCGVRGAEAEGLGSLVHRGPYADLYLARSPVRGCVVAVWNGEHVAEPTELPEAEALGYLRQVVCAGRAVAEFFMPAKLNYETHGNAVPHLHTRIIPRHWDDPAPGAPLPPHHLRGRPGRAHAADVRALAALLRRYG